MISASTCLTGSIILKIRAVAPILKRYNHRTIRTSLQFATMNKEYTRDSTWQFSQYPRHSNITQTSPRDCPSSKLPSGIFLIQKIRQPDSKRPTLALGRCMLLFSPFSRSHKKKKKSRYTSEWLSFMHIK